MPPALDVLRAVRLGHAVQVRRPRREPQPRARAPPRERRKAGSDAELLLASRGAPRAAGLRLLRESGELLLELRPGFNREAARAVLRDLPSEAVLRGARQSLGP